LWRRSESATRDLRRPTGRSSKEEAVLRRLVLLFWAMMATLLMVGGVAQAEVLLGTDGPDWLVGTVDDDRISGLGSDDYVQDAPTDDGPSGNDSLSGGEGDDSIHGERGNDSVSGGPGDEDVSGGLGSDVVSGDDGDDHVDEGPPFDASHDKVYGGTGNDVVDTYNNPAVADLSSCGPGNDIAYADEKDIVANDCEKIVRGPEPTSDDLIAFPRPPGPGYPV
jgi:Ca2+-binding RTX toxin-like protein